jgi:3-dehydroquinate dehydratase/shikimate dehydrogenase
MAGNKAAPILEAKDLNTRLVFDLVYNPLETPLLRLARQMSIPIVTGVEMFVQQGARQFEIWTGKPAPEEEMLRVVIHALRQQAEAAPPDPTPEPKAPAKSASPKPTAPKPSAPKPSAHKPAAKPAAHKPATKVAHKPSAKSSPKPAAKPAAKSKSKPAPKPQPKCHKPAKKKSR